MSDQAALKRQLKIKTGVVKRCVLSPQERVRSRLITRLSPAFLSKRVLVSLRRAFCLPIRSGLRVARPCSLLKELTVYKSELEDQQRKLDKFIADGAEDWDIKNGVSGLPCRCRRTRLTPHASAAQHAGRIQEDDSSHTDTPRESCH